MWIYFDRLCLSEMWKEFDFITTLNSLTGIELVAHYQGNSIDLCLGLLNWLIGVALKSWEDQIKDQRENLS